ncbi:MAG TPA: carboxypeptidase regulatory-like domain-containing protein, partial [Longimicrobiales bacterium]|nr:carboxypeptidase regulatory-like domain-containing protein [Longimicrobiales bacterium]
MPPFLALLLTTVLAATGAPAPPAPPDAVVEGTVRDAVHGWPVAGASVMVREAPVSGGVRHALTDSAGRYRVAGVARGRYVLAVERFGYHRTSIEVTVGSDDALMVSILLRPLALRLGMLELHAARGAGPADSAAASGAAAAGTTGAALLARQQDYLSGDV